jgi:hypothetical protein
VKSIVLALFILSSVYCCAQQPTDIIALSDFFTGGWSCAGEFANGKKIEADASFVRELDGKWLLYRHSDRPPGPFKALAMWGVDQLSGKTISVMQDNFGNARFFSSEGWKDGSITFTRSAMLDQKMNSEDRFRYQRQSNASFKMTYERLVDGKWKLGDFLVCTRK